MCLDLSAQEALKRGVTERMPQRKINKTECAKFLWAKTTGWNECRGAAREKKSIRRIEAKEKGKQKQHRGYMDHTFILPAECFLCFILLLLLLFWLELFSVGRETDKSPGAQVNTTQGQKRWDRLTVYFRQNYTNSNDTCFAVWVI